MSWLSKQLKSAGKIVKNPIKWAENAGRSIGKVNRQIAPYVGLIPGVGPALGAATGAFGSVLEGRNMKGHIRSGIAGGLSGLANQQLAGGQGYKAILSRVPGMGAGTSAMPTTAAAGNTAVSAVPSSAGSLMGQYGGTGAGGLFPSAGGGIGVGAGQIGGSLGSATLPGITSLGTSAAASAAPSLLGRALSFAEKNPNVMAGGLSALGGLGGNDREDRLMDAQSERIEQETGESSYDLERRKQREEQLAQIFADLGIETSGFRDVAPNPYSMAG